MEEDLTTLLLADEPLNALVANRIHWATLPQGVTAPAVLLHTISGAPTYHMQGESLSTARVQIDARGTTFTSAMTVARAVRSVLSGYSGTVGGTFFSAVFQLGGRSDFDKTGAENFHVVMTDFEIFHRAAS